MFKDAIERVAHFTRPIHTILRTYAGKQIIPGAATLFFVNEEGYAALRTERSAFSAAGAYLLRHRRHLVPAAGAVCGPVVGAAPVQSSHQDLAGSRDGRSVCFVGNQVSFVGEIGYTVFLPQSLKS